MDIHQTSSKISDKRWKWAISLQGAKEELDRVAKVIYHLHPTFTQPVVETSNREDNFEFSTSGWGTFVVRIEIHYSNGEIEELRHRLVFEHEKPKVFVSYPTSESDSEVVRALIEQARNLGWDVTSADLIDPSADWNSALNKQMDDAQLFVMIGGKTPSRAIMEEIATARQLGKEALILDNENLYDLEDEKHVADGNELIDAFKAVNFKTKGV